jgi:hypothetical protein
MGNPLRRIPHRWHGVVWITAAVVLVYAVATALLALPFGVALGVALGGQVLTLYALAVALGWPRPEPRRPQLEVALDAGTGPMRERIEVLRKTPIRPIDATAIVRDNEELARQSITPRPAPRRDTWGLMPEFSEIEPYDASLRRFESDLSEYTGELHRWLQAYERLRWPTSSFLEAWLRLHNAGDGPADDVRVEVIVPSGLILVERAPTVPRPPTIPEFERRSRLHLEPIDLGQHLANREPGPEEARGSIAGPSWRRDGDVQIATFSIGVIPHGATELSAFPIRCIASKAGTYELRWKLYASNLSQRTTGTITIHARPQLKESGPARTLGDLLRSGEVRVEDVDLTHVLSERLRRNVAAPADRESSPSRTGP